MSGGNIRVRAGKAAYELIRAGRFNLDRIATYFGPAGGPRWLVASGFDLTLIREGSLGKRQPVWLVGASAGAWRFAAWLQPEPEKSYAALREAYTAVTYARGDTPETILDKLLNVINAYIEDDALPFALNHKRYRLAILTARTRHLAASEIGWIQKGGLALCLLGNMISRTNLARFAERVVFFHGPRPPAFCTHPEFQGRFIGLSPNNFKQAVMASGAIPLVVAGLWMLIALVRRQVTSFLGGAALVGVGLSALLDAQDIAALRDTLLGTVLVTVGLGVVVRGFLLRGRTVR